MAHDPETGRQAWTRQAIEQLDRAADDLSFLAAIVNIPSPTGEERALAEFLCREMQSSGLRSELQPIDATSANALGRLGDGTGPSLLLFAPLDSAFSGIAEEEVPWVGPQMRPDLLPQAVIEGDRVVGLSADNPKAHIVALVAAARAVAKAGVPLTGRVQLAFGAGGAPSNRRPHLSRYNVGHGSGCEFLLQQGVRGDFAIIAKPGYAVAWEEVGLTWFRLRIHGTQAYVGRRHIVVDDNPIVHAARVIDTLERWFREYGERHTSGLCQPQGAIGAIEGGWKYKPAFTPAACDLYVDLRITPRCPPLQAWRELEACLDPLRATGLRIDCDLILAIPGEATDPANWIIRTCIASWEATEGRTHAPLLKTSGQTEAAILRRHGIPTARFGLPAVMSPDLLAQGEARPTHTMGVVNAESIRRYSECIVRVIIETCTRRLDEVGL